jgi:hypothetical protein
VSSAGSTAVFPAEPDPGWYWLAIAKSVVRENNARVLPYIKDQQKEPDEEW